MTTMSSAEEIEVPIKGQMLVHKYSAFGGNLYAPAGARVSLVGYRGSVVIVEDESGNRFSARNTDVFFGEGPIDVEQSVSLENSLPAGRKKKTSRAIPVDQTPTLF